MKNIANPTFYFFWYRIVPKEIFFYFNILRYKLLDLFSIPIILNTFFEPWKRDIIHVPHASLEVRFHIWMLNMVSRFIGATLRFIVIIGFCLAMIVYLFVFISVLFFWLFFPLILIGLTSLGIYYLILGLNHANF